MRSIASGQGDVELRGKFQQAVEKAVHPALGKLGRQGQRKERCDGISAHGCNVAESARQAAVANALRGMPFAAKMYPFETEVSGDQRLVACGNTQDGAVVSDAGGDRGLGSDAPADGGYQGSFG